MSYPLGQKFDITGMIECLGHSLTDVELQDLLLFVTFDTARARFIVQLSALLDRHSEEEA